MRKIVLVVVILCVMVTAICHAVPVYVDAVATDFDSLLGGSAYAVDDAMISNFSGSLLSAEIVSQVFTDGVGSFLYLYQLHNTGAANATEVITRFTASPYISADIGTSLGYLTANIPTAFTAGDQAPLYGDVDVLGPTVGFNFPVGNPLYGIPDSYIAPSESSLVLYVQSSLGPGLVTGNIINGGVYSNAIYGPVPEPCSLVLLSLGGLMLRRRRRVR